MRVHKSLLTHSYERRQSFVVRSESIIQASAGGQTTISLRLSRSNERRAFHMQIALELRL